MEMPDYAYPPDPKKADKGWKEITSRCQPSIKKIMAKATELFGQPTNPADMPVRVTDFSEGPRTCFHNGIAYIRIPPGVSSDERELESQLAHEMIHVLSKREFQNTVLEEGFCSYFAVKYFGAHPPHAGDRNQQKYYEAYSAVTELLEKCPDVIKQLRKPPRSIDKISADEIRKLCAACSDELAKKLVSKF